MLNYTDIKPKETAINWKSQLGLSARELEQIQASMTYAESTPGAGLPGHSLMLLVAGMAKLLTAYQEKATLANALVELEKERVRLIEAFTLGATPENVYREELAVVEAKINEVKAGNLYAIPF